MSDRRQMTDEQEQWHAQFYRLIDKMQRNVIRGDAFSQILNAERFAARQDAPHDTETQLNGDL